MFLSRSKDVFSVKVAQIENPMASTEQDQVITLGAIDLKHCIQQIIASSPENFNLTTEDYAVYYKDLTEQPEEPFVSNGVLSSLITSSETCLVPGRVCQNLSASFLFGDNSSKASTLTLEIRLKFHTIDQKPQTIHQQNNIVQLRSHVQRTTQQSVSNSHSSKSPHQSSNSHMPEKRYLDSGNYPQKKMKQMNSMSSAIKATRTKSLPIFSHIPSQTMFNIMNQDKMNKPSRYDSSSVKDRFKSAPFLQSKILDNPAKQRRSRNDATRAMRTRSMTTTQPLISSPIHEEPMSDSTDDTEYRVGEDNHNPGDNDDDCDDDIDNGFDEGSPYTPQQPPYKPLTNSSASGAKTSFHSLPDLEDLDSKRTHTISSTKLPKNHGLVCVNPNCATIDSITWRYFETGFHPNYFEIHRATEFDKKHYDGMFGPLCNACFLFLRNKGFMRPEGVVKKYLQQQKYKQDLKKKEEATAAIITASSSNSNNNSGNTSSTEDRSLNAIASKKANQVTSSPILPQFHKFPTPSHTPSAINQVIQNQKNSNNPVSGNTNASHISSTPNYNDLNDFMNQLNNFGGPLTDIDPLPQDQGVTPPMMAEKSNTRVINLYEDGDDKENFPPATSPNTQLGDFESMLVKSFATSEKSSPEFHQDWVNTLLFPTEPTPKDQGESKTPQDIQQLPPMKTFVNEKLTPLDQNLDIKRATVSNMPSSPVGSSIRSDGLDAYMEKNKASSSPTGASRNNTTNLIMSWGNQNNNTKPASTPNSEFFSNDDSLLDKACNSNTTVNQNSEKNTDKANY